MDKSNNSIIENEVILKLQNIQKKFGEVIALKSVNLKAYVGKCTAVLGENGAGKSTLMNIISGVFKKTSGEILYNGKTFNPKNVKNAEKHGIVIIHQELITINDMSINDNLFLGNEILNSFGNIDYKKQIKIIEETFRELDISIDPRKKMGLLTIAEQQIVEIAKAVIRNAKVIIMDEPSSSLSEKETQALFKIVKQLKSNGKAIIYISHKLQEIPIICDFITIIRDGTFIGEYKVGEISEDEMISKMVGRELTERFPQKINSEKNDYTILDVKQLSSPILKNISFQINKGEILGFSGLVGAGRTELFKTLIGILPSNIMDVYLNNKKVNFNSPHSAIKKGLYYVTEDRKEEGLILTESIKNNISLSSLQFMENKLFKFISNNKQNKLVTDFMQKTKIKALNYNYKINQLSGGNQQKVLISKSIAARPKVIVFDEPTRGVDVGARKEIYDLIVELKQKGVGIAVISSDLPEIIGLCDRVLVMKHGTITKELMSNELEQENIIKYAI